MEGEQEHPTTQEDISKAEIMMTDRETYESAVRQLDIMYPEWHDEPSKYPPLEVLFRRVRGPVFEVALDPEDGAPAAYPACVFYRHIFMIKNTRYTKEAQEEYGDLDQNKVDHKIAILYTLPDQRTFVEELGDDPGYVINSATESSVGQWGGTYAKMRLRYALKGQPSKDGYNHELSLSGDEIASLAEDELLKRSGFDKKNPLDKEAVQLTVNYRLEEAVINTEEVEKLIKFAGKLIEKYSEDNHYDLGELATFDNEEETEDIHKAIYSVLYKIESTFELSGRKACYDVAEEIMLREGLIVDDMERIKEYLEGYSQISESSKRLQRYLNEVIGQASVIGQEPRTGEGSGVRNALRHERHAQKE